MTPISDSEELETIFKSLKHNKAAGIDTINSNIVLDTCDKIKDILFLIFMTSLQQGTFPNMSKIANVTSLFKSGDAENVTNYSRIYKNQKNNLLFDKQFEFQLNNSTEHAILQLVIKVETH